MKFMRWGMRDLSPACALLQYRTPQGSGLSWNSDIPLTVWGSHSPGPLGPYCPPAIEVGEAHATSSVLCALQP